MKRKLKFSKSVKIFFIAEFLQNFARTLPHAILVIYMLSKGLDLKEIAFVQSIFMLTSTIFEFPSGVVADYFLRKSIYLVSIATIFVSYLLIGFFTDNLVILSFGYFLYGLSSALKTGTVESDIVLDYRNKNLDIKDFSVFYSYVENFSAILGGLIGGFLYKYFYDKIYIFSIVFFALSFIVSIFIQINLKDKEVIKRTTLRKELTSASFIIKDNLNLKRIIILYMISMFFIQPFYQYWQVAYKEINLDVKYFGIIYIIFQGCNIVGSFIYSKVSFKNMYKLIIGLIPIVMIFNFYNNYFILFTLPIAVILFFIYERYLDVYCKRNSPEKYMSSFISLVGTVCRLSSIVSMFLMASLINYVGVFVGYFIMFLLFFIFSVICIK